MAGNKSQTIRGLKVSVSAKDWLHRVIRWPFYFESTNYSFNIKIERVSDDDDLWPNDTIRFIALYGGPGLASGQEFPVEVPGLQVGESKTIAWEEIYISRPSLVELGIVVRPGQDPGIATLFSYKVRPEEALWIAGGVVLLTLVTVGVPILAARFDDPPIVINELPAATAEPFDEVSPTPLTTLGAEASLLQPMP